LFPEGSRTLDGLLQPMMPGFCALARRARPTLVPVGIAGAYEALPRGSSMPRLRPIRLRFGKAIPPEEYAEMDDDQLVELITDRISQCIDEAASG
jgi:1-acyl-sn-glycerol-3-phosphate acyltransferase